MPTEIKLAKTDKVLELQEPFSMYKDANFQTSTLNKVAFTDPALGKVYYYSSDYDQRGCFYVMHPDGTIAQYAYNPKFFEGKGETISWNNADKNNTMQDYGYAQKGCGVEGNCYYVENVNESNLEQAGTGDKGTKFYTVKTGKENASIDNNNSAEEVTLWQLYTSYKMTYEYSDPKPATDMLTLRFYIKKIYYIGKITR
jgi:hypothetical protein